MASLKAWSVYHRTKQNLKRGIDRAAADVARPLIHRREEQYEATYPSLLPGDAIRLLEIVSKDHRDGTIHCRLKTYPRNRAPRYDAVSYCWGDDTTTTSIICNGLELQVRQNLKAFLEACSRNKTLTRPLWIDAICLNQGDVVEKSIHVPLMSHVYQRASRTIIWLGEPDVDTEDTLLWLTTTMPKWIADIKRNDSSHPHYIKSRGRIEFPEQWNAVNDYLSRPWFRRLWCVQEIMLSRDIYVLSDTESLPLLSWKQMCECLEMLPAGPLTHDSSQPGIMRYREADEIASTIEDPRLMEEFRQQLHSYGPEMLGMTLVQYFMASRICREPVDRVWSQLGLLPPDLVTLVREADIIDYSEHGRREYWKSYFNFMKVLYAYDERQFFVLIFEDLGRGRNLLLPSWCPDFTRTDDYQSFRGSREFRAGFVDKDDRTQISSTLTATGALSMLGFQIDTVSNVALVWNMVNPGIERPAMAKTKAECCIIYEWLESSRQLWETTNTQANEGIKSLCCTMNAAGPHRKKKVEYKDEWSQFHEALEENVAGIASDVIEREVDSGQPYSDYAIGMMNACDGRRIFNTKNGRLGLGPATSQEGDIICTFPGLQVLCILRETAVNPVADTAGQTELISPPSAPLFKLVGDAYVYEMMYGEAFTAPDRGPEQYFTIV